jgi:hypothetical protein
MLTTDWLITKIMLFQRMAENMNLDCSDFIRIVRRLYGAPYRAKPLCHNDLNGAYTDYTDFFGHTPFRRERCEKRDKTYALSRAWRYVYNRIIRIIRIKHVANRYKSTLAALYGF